MKKTAIIVLIVAAVIAVILIWQSTRPEATVQVVAPRVETIRVFVDEQAKTELPRDYLIAMPIAGWLEPITMREGDAVEEGQVVASLDTADLSDRVRQAEAKVAELRSEIEKNEDNRLENHALVETEATVKAIDETVKASEAKLRAALAVADFARSEVQRLEQMQEAQAAAEREMRQAETEKRKAEAEYQGDALNLAALKTLAAVSYIGPQFIRDYIDRKKFELASLQQQLKDAELELEIARRNVDRAEMKSPINGVVLERMQTRHQYLAAGTPVMTLGRLDDMEVIAEVLTERAAWIQPGDVVDVYGEAIGEKPITGHVVRIYPAGFEKVSSLGVEQQRVKVAIRLDQRPKRLGVAYRVQVRIYYDQADDALTIPRTAIYRGDKGEWKLMTVENGETRTRTVSVGLINDERVQITDGLDKSAQVVARPSRDITPGMNVAIE